MCSVSPSPSRFIYLKGKITETEEKTERERAVLHIGSPPQLGGMATAGPDRNQEPGTPPEFLTPVAGPSSRAVPRCLRREL